jgi:manganese/iron transport system permease protein
MDWSALIEPLQYPFMRNAFLICCIVSIPTALLSCFLVIKGWALMGDAVSHAVLPGIVAAYFFNLPLIAGAFAAGMVCAIATGWIAENSRIKRDTVMGVVFSGMFAVGMVMYVAIETDVHLDHILFGNILGVGTADLAIAGLISLGVTAFLILQSRDLLLASFDPAQAQASGLSVKFLHYGLLAALSLTIVATLSAAGLILAIGLLVSPGAIAYLLVRRFTAMLAVAVLVCAFAMLAGTYASFFIDSAPAPTIVLILTLMFVLALARQQLRARHAEQAGR